MEIFDKVQSFAATVLSIVLAYFAPITDMVFVIFFIFMLNCVAGMVSGIVAQNEKFSTRKFFHCLLETLVFYAIVACVWVIGDRMHNQGGAMQCITGIVYAIVYFYGVNILRNAVAMFPTSRVLKFLYWLLSFEAIKKIPYIAQFVAHEEKEKEDKK